MAAERRFRVMGCDAHVVVVGAHADLAAEAEDRLRQLESRWSRFLDDSEVSRLNAVAGSWTRVSTDTFELIARAVRGWQVTDGAYDPTVLGDVLRAGYTADLVDVVSHRAPEPGSALVTGCAGVELHLPTRLVRLPYGVGFDPGGIGKGLAADMVVDELLEAGAAGACVNVGGDLRVAGDAPQPGGWVVALDHPDGRHPLATLQLQDGAVATSSTVRRTWTVDGESRHHVIDPDRASATDNGLVTATAVAGRGWQAEVLAKALLVRGAEVAAPLVRRLGATGCLLDADDQLYVLDGFDQLSPAPPAPAPARAPEVA